MQLTLWQGALSVGAADVTQVRVLSPPTAGAPQGFPGMQDLTAVAQWLSAELAQPVVLTLTHNRATMASFRHVGQGVRVRLHRVFLYAQEPHMRALVKFVQGERQAGKVLDQFVADHMQLAGLPPPIPIRSAGQVHDLASLFAQVNADYFHGACGAQITWGTWRQPRGRRRLQVGAYLPAYNLICMHPCLDQAFVPRYYVAWAVFSQMLCELFGLGVPRRKRAAVPAEFAALQSCHPDFFRCKVWEQEHGSALLQYKPPHPHDRGVVKRPRTLG